MNQVFLSYMYPPKNEQQYQPKWLDAFLKYQFLTIDPIQVVRPHLLKSSIYLSK